MSYRYNTIDIIVGIGMCAILFGALLLFAAANGTYQVALPQSLSPAPSVEVEFGVASLQPALGRAIVDQALFERRANHAMAQSASEWNRATLAYHEFRSRPGGSIGAIMRQAMTVPAEHHARVQGILGRAIVHFTARGVRNGRVSADLPHSDYNTTMIRVTEARGQRLHHDFESTWQTTLGRNLVHAIQQDKRRAGALQERLGAALVQVTQAQTGAEEVRATTQEQLASLVMAAIRAQVPEERGTLVAATESPKDEGAAASAEPGSWPEIPMGYLMIAGVLLMASFWGGLSWAAQSREKKALAEMRYDASRWVYRVAA
ncbi:MAG TPA: hypothetical protein VD738_07775 [Nitrospira sp.]|nr:hypothetical protein [Nitrospira sp.]